jgi:hypothetical protein
MEEEKTKTRVIFKMTPEEFTGSGVNLHNSECIAFLLDMPANFGRVESYMHVGQHSEASLDYMLNCKRATPEQYSDLKKELESIGYDLKVRVKWVYSANLPMPWRM